MKVIESTRRLLILSLAMAETPFHEKQLPEVVRDFKPRLKNTINMIQRFNEKLDPEFWQTRDPKMYARTKSVFEGMAVVMSELEIKDIERLHELLEQMKSGEEINFITDAELKKRDEGNRTTISMAVKKTGAYKSLNDDQKKEINKAITTSKLKYEIEQDRSNG